MNRPNQDGIHVHVGVNNAVAKAAEGTPRHLRMTRLESLRQSLGRFGDGVQPAQCGVVGVLVGEEGNLTSGSGGLDPIDCL